MPKKAAIFSHFDLFEKTSDKNQEKKKRITNYFAIKLIVIDLKN